jgi:formylglycine-generating enzyme required for sulfatase activity
MEFHAGNTKLVQMLRKGHGGVRLSDEAWSRIITWIDLHAPEHGTWRETTDRPPGDLDYKIRRRRELRKLYAGMDEDPESDIAIPPAALAEPVVVARSVSREAARAPQCAGWPFDATEARRRQAAVGGSVERVVELGDGLTMAFVLVPPGRFVMGDADGLPDESPAAVVTIHRPFWLGKFEVTNEQFRLFDPGHDSLREHGWSQKFAESDFMFPANDPEQPVVRVSWRRAVAFCRWLSRGTGVRFTLPTEAQWEYACRAGTATALSYGGVDADFSKHANVADATMARLPAHSAFTQWMPPWHLKDERFRDGRWAAAPGGAYAANAWGLHDMHGNVAEWTRSRYRAYPYADDGRNAGDTGDRVVLGGSWDDRPKRCRSAFRLPYRPWQGVYNVGFRVAAPGGLRLPRRFRQVSRRPHERATSAATPERLPSAQRIPGS